MDWRGNVGDVYREKVVGIFLEKFFKIVKVGWYILEDIFKGIILKDKRF